MSASVIVRIHPLNSSHDLQRQKCQGVFIFYKLCSMSRPLTYTLAIGYKNKIISGRVLLINFSSHLIADRLFLC